MCSNIDKCVQSIQWFFDQSPHEVTKVISFFDQSPLNFDSPHEVTKVISFFPTKVRSTLNINISPHAVTKVINFSDQSPLNFERQYLLNFERQYLQNCAVLSETLSIDVEITRQTAKLPY